MTHSDIQIAIIDYPGAMQSALMGLQEMFTLTNGLCDKNSHNARFHTTIVNETSRQEASQDQTIYQVVIIPPDLGGCFHSKPSGTLTNWIHVQHQQGAIICSSCAGTLVLAEMGLLKNRRATTHWNLADKFNDLYPETQLDVEKILINDGDIITAGGLMSWLDLGLELVAQLTQPCIMRQLGKLLIVDTGSREQKYYQSFSPKLDHGDKAILKAQHYLQTHYAQPVSVSQLAALSCLTERTFLRHFVQATRHKPNDYLQRLRIQKACDLIESSAATFETIAMDVGYEDNSAFRKTFRKITGLTPSEFKRRFA
ncbi:GlxA family transcriptional regulator [Litoribacillus peritrichatus]|uniref:Helix-turn-helix domain-containing protein n=1 Tax=Litoribacillus peritrichatus TaxID=718191 RepID=A0ABP7MUG2_9GAMM